MAGLYIHIPFCKKRCNYCDFFSTTDEGLKDAYVAALCRELEAQRSFLGNEPLKTVYFGGGTPSQLPPDMLAGIFATIQKLWDCSALEEVTLEANPDDLTAEYLHSIAKLPINRLSIGIQSFDDGLLSFMNRRHTAKDARRAVEEARRAGLRNISIDLIYGIPGMSRRQWEDSLEQAVSLRPEHISAYHLTIEPGTPFALANLQSAPDETGEGHYRMLCEKLSRAGYEHYEISNFALPGFEARHNSGYWSGEPYLGAGPSAHSYDGRRLRRWNEQSLADYLRKPEYESETLSDNDLWNEYVMTSLRTSSGINADALRDRFGREALAVFEIEAGKWLSSGALKREGGRYFIEGPQLFVSDGIISSFFR